MPGVVGFIGYEISQDQELLLQKMAQGLEPEGGYKIELYEEQGVGLGRISLGSINPESQPIWNADQTRCIILEGELYDSEPLKRELVRKGYRFQVDNDAELILQLYEEYGDSFAIKLNGAFIAAIWDRIEKSLLIINDRLGLFPLYYSQSNGGLLFASGVRALLAVPTQKRTVDRVSIAELLTFDHLLNDRTLIEEIRLLPQGSILRFDYRGMQICPYWMPQYQQHYPLFTELEYIEQFQFLMRQAVKRQMQGDLPLGLLLSGGLDSRILLAFMSEVNGNKFHSFTWGIPGCDDARYASEAAQRALIPHHFYKLEPDWLLGHAERAVQMTDGMGNIVNLHALATLDEETRYAKVIYKGFLGDAMMGYGLRYQLWGDFDREASVRLQFNVHLDQGLISVTPEEQQLLFTDAFKENTDTLVMDDYFSAMEAANTSSPADQRNFFDFRQRVPRMTIKGVEVVRSKADVRLPFCDNDLVEFSLMVPPGLRYNRRLVKDAFVKEFPQLAQIPITETGYPMMICTRDVLLRASRVIRYQLHKKGLGWLVGPVRRPYQDYDRWFRTVLQQWVEEVLLSKRALEREYFNPEYLRKLISEHKNGANHTVSIGALLSIELWHRQYID